MSAALKTFAIFELIERVLLQLPDLRDVITCQRVCRDWNSVIESSRPLQRHLFYDTSVAGREDMEGLNLQTSECPIWQLNPLLEHFLNGYFIAIEYENDEFEYLGQRHSVQLGDLADVLPDKLRKAVEKNHILRNDLDIYDCPYQMFEIPVALNLQRLERPPSDPWEDWDPFEYGHLFDSWFSRLGQDFD